MTITLYDSRNHGDLHTLIASLSLLQVEKREARARGRERERRGGGMSVQMTRHATLMPSLPLDEA